MPDVSDFGFLPLLTGLFTGGDSLMFDSGTEIFILRYFESEFLLVEGFFLKPVHLCLAGLIVVLY